MSYNKPIRRIAIVGTGVIGASWAAEYLRARISTWTSHAKAPRGSSKPEWLPV